MSFIIRPYEEYREDEILPLYQAVGWTNYTQRPEMIRNAYLNSFCTLGACMGDRLVGVLRAVGDGHSILYVQDIIVAPAEQRRGIGSALLRMFLERYPEVYQIVLSTDAQPKTISFYESVGFTPHDALGCTAFMRMRKEPQ